MTTITISRQMGSLGCQIAHQVKDRLGYQIIWRELINQAALKAGAPEVALAVIDELDLFGLRPTKQEFQAYLSAVEQVMQSLAAEGSWVIVGRAGQSLLKGRQDVLHVRLIAPASLRAERIAERHGVSLKAAQAQIQTSDRARSLYLRRFFNLDWDDPNLYDLMINTGRHDPSWAADLICQAAGAVAGIGEQQVLQEEQTFE
jgi:CMP/dCMP kinase